MSLAARAIGLELVRAIQNLAGETAYTQAELRWVPEFTSEQLASIRVVVTPLEREIGLEARDLDSERITLAVSVQKLVADTDADGTDEDEAEAVMAVCEDLANKLARVDLETAGLYASIDSMTHAPMLDRKTLRERSIAVSVLRITYLTTHERD